MTTPAKPALSTTVDPELAQQLDQGEPTPEMRQVKEKFFAHKAATKGEPPQPLTPLQQRMQSGGA